MRKYLYQITMRIFPVYFTALIIAIIILALFIGAPKVHAQTNHVDFNAMIASAPLNSTTTLGLVDQADVIVTDEIKAKVEISSDDQDQFMQIHANRVIHEIFIYDNSNRVMEDIKADYSTGQVDVSGLCPGVYYIRVDYQGGSHLRRFVIN